MNPRLQRAALLLDQSRSARAEEELRLALVEEPDNAWAHALLARCLAARKDFQAATDEARLAVHLAPEQPFTHYSLSLVLSERNHLPEALAAIQEALRLDPYDADYYARLAALQFESRRWAEALAASEQGLACDPEHTACTNLKAMALVKLGRKELAGAAIEAALARNPDDAVTHANQGWTLIEKGEHAEALAHFREALRLDPESEWARQGIVEALRARYFVYRIMLGYFLWMMKLSGQAQWGILLGLYFGYQGLRMAANANPALGPWVTPLLVAYGVFAIMTWISRPLFNLVLRLSRFGRLALSREEIVTSNWIGLLLLSAVGFLAVFLFTGQVPWLWAALVCGLTIPPVSSVYNCESGWPRTAMTLLSAGLFLFGALCVGSQWLVPRLPAEFAQVAGRLANEGPFYFAIAAVASQFAAMFLSQTRVRR